MALLTCTDVTLSWGSRTAVTGLNFCVEKGQYLCIIGENGAGKTTLLKALLSLIRPSGGTIFAGDSLVPGDTGYLPQQTVIQKNFPASVSEIVLSGRLNSAFFKPFYTKADHADAEAKMDMLHITGLKNRCYRELSGGQQQRVLLARAFCAAKKLLLLDEPAAGLDPAATQEMYESIRNINTKSGMTVIMVSHDVRGALAYASHILHLADKKQLFFGTVSEYRSSCICSRFQGVISNV